MLRQKGKEALELIKQHKVRKITPQMWEVEEHKIHLIIKQGRAILTCDCENSTKFCSSSNICLHRLSVILLESPNKFDLDVQFMENQIKELINERSNLSVQLKKYKQKFGELK